MPRPRGAKNPWALFAVDLLKDGKPRPYLEVVRLVMDEVPPSRAAAAYVSQVNRQTPKNITLDHKVATGARRVAKNALLTKQFIIEDDQGNQVRPTKYNQDVLTIRINPNRTKDFYANSLGKNQEEEFEERRVNISDEEALETLVNLSSKVAVVERGLLAHRLTPNGPLVTPVTLNKVGGILKTGYLSVAANGQATVHVVWPQKESRQVFDSVKEAFKNSGWRPHHNKE